jgi:DNA-binding LacI/PurR family transcriptional regulator
MSSRPVTLEDVAAHAKVSKMTVSLCLREDGWMGRASAATRARVMASVRELGYRPNIRGRALRLGKTNVIAFYAGHGFVNVRIPYFTEIVSGLQEGCELVQKDLLLHGTFHTSTTEDIFGELLDGRIDGLVVNMSGNDPLVEHLKRSNFSFVAVADEIEGVPSILVDDAGGAAILARHLYDQGHRKLAYCSSPTRTASDLARLSSFRAVAADLGMHLSEVLPYSNGEWGNCLKEAMDLGATAFPCWNDDQARDVFNALLEIGVEIPKQIAVTGFDGCPTPFREAWPLTTIAAPWSEVGKSAVLHLNARMAGEALAPRIVLPVRFVRGTTS